MKSRARYALIISTLFLAGLATTASTASADPTFGVMNASGGIGPWGTTEPTLPRAHRRRLDRLR